MCDRIRVVHAANEALEPLYEEAHVLSCLLEPTPYREFVMPVKLFEYLGQGRPLLATAGSAAGQFVSTNDIGWSIPYQIEALAEFLRSLRHRSDYAAKATKADRLAPAHTWRARAETVARDLGGRSGAEAGQSDRRAPASAAPPPDFGAHRIAASGGLTW